MFLAFLGHGRYKTALVAWRQDREEKRSDLILCVFFRLRKKRWSWRRSGRSWQRLLLSWRAGMPTGRCQSLFCSVSVLVSWRCSVLLFSASAALSVAPAVNNLNYNGSTGMINGLVMIQVMFSMDIKVIITIWLPQSSCTVINRRCSAVSCRIKWRNLLYSLFMIDGWSVVGPEEQVLIWLAIDLPLLHIIAAAS